MKFKCDVCGKEFDPDPDSMVETGIEAVVLDAVEADRLIATGELLAENDPELEKWASGAMCICTACQDKMVEDDEGEEWKRF